MSEGLTNSFETAIRGLRGIRSLAFGCSCAEHVLPFYEKLCTSPAPRNALDRLWAVTKGEIISDREAQHLSQLVGASIPSISASSYSLNDDIAMRSGVAVLECLDILSDNEDAAVNVGFLVFDVIMLVELRRNPRKIYMYEVFEALENDLELPNDVKVEWKRLQALLRSIQSPGLPEWTTIQADSFARGRELALLL